jgi:hypothetical protein
MSLFKYEIRLSLPRVNIFIFPMRDRREAGIATLADALRIV